MNDDEYERWFYSPEEEFPTQKETGQGNQEWRLETEGPEVFVAVCSRCGKRTKDPDVLIKLLDDFSPRRRRWMR